MENQGLSLAFLLFVCRVCSGTNESFTLYRSHGGTLYSGIKPAGTQGIAHVDFISIEDNNEHGSLPTATHQKALEGHKDKLIHFTDGRLRRLHSATLLDNKIIEVIYSRERVRFTVASETFLPACVGDYLTDGSVHVRAVDLNGEISTSDLWKHGKALQEVAGSQLTLIYITDSERRIIDSIQLGATEDEGFIVNYSCVQFTFSLNYPDTTFYHGIIFENRDVKITRIQDENEQPIGGDLPEFGYNLKDNINNVIYLPNGVMKTLTNVSCIRKKYFCITYSNDEVGFSFYGASSHNYVATCIQTSGTQRLMKVTTLNGDTDEASLLAALKGDINGIGSLVVINGKYIRKIELVSNQEQGVFATLSTANVTFSVEPKDRLSYIGYRFVQGEVVVTGKGVLGDDGVMQTLKNSQNKLEDYQKILEDMRVRGEPIYFGAGIKKKIDDVLPVKCGAFKLKYSNFV